MEPPPLESTANVALKYGQNSKSEIGFPDSVPTAPKFLENFRGNGNWFSWFDLIGDGSVAVPMGTSGETEQRDFSDRLRKSEWEVREIPIEVARGLVRKYHYARGASNTRIHCHGMFPVGSFWDLDCVGVAWWLAPTRSAAEATYPANWQGVLSLSRLVIAPSVPKNACTFLLARSVKMIDAVRWPCLVTYADDWRGHTGTIYRASNWKYLGKTKPQPTYTINGVMTSRKAGPTTRTHEEMLALGAVLEGFHAKHKFVLIR